MEQDDAAGDRPLHQYSTEAAPSTSVQIQSFYDGRQVSIVLSVQQAVKVKK